MTVLCRLGGRTLDRPWLGLPMKRSTGKALSPSRIYPPSAHEATQGRRRCGWAGQVGARPDLSLDPLAAHLSARGYWLGPGTHVFSLFIFLLSFLVFLNLVDIITVLFLS